MVCSFCAVCSRFLLLRESRKSTLLGESLTKPPKEQILSFFVLFPRLLRVFPTKTDQIKHSAVARFVIFVHISSQQNKWFVPRFPTNFIFGPRFPNKTNGLFLQTTFCKPLAKCNKMAKWTKWPNRRGAQWMHINLRCFRRRTPLRVVIVWIRTTRRTPTIMFPRSRLSFNHNDMLSRESSFPMSYNVPSTQMTNTRYL